jgi:hypothetical protein
LVLLSVLVVAYSSQRSAQSGYRDGLEKGKSLSVQDGFNTGDAVKLAELPMGNT